MHCLGRGLEVAVFTSSTNYTICLVYIEMDQASSDIGLMNRHQNTMFGNCASTP